jgi:hypothetical protein
VAATFNPGTLQGSVEFSQVLAGGPLGAGNWSLRYDGVQYDATSAVAVGAVVFMNFTSLGLGSGGRLIYYSPPPFDVANQFGEQAVGFSAFPVA